MVGFTSGESVQEVFKLHKRLADAYNEFVKKTPLIRIGLVICVLPIVLAFITSLTSGSSMFDESSGTGAYLWLLIMSVPIGLLLVVIGLVVKLFKGRKPKN